MAQMNLNHDVNIVKVFEANFTTTTPNDRLVSQLILMSSVQKYFNFNTYIACGIPEVKLIRLDFTNLPIIMNGY